MVIFGVDRLLAASAADPCASHRSGMPHPERTHAAWLSDPARKQLPQANCPSGQYARCLEKPTGAFVSSHIWQGLAQPA
jgi:hypothetical protein